MKKEIEIAKLQQASNYRTMRNTFRGGWNAGHKGQTGHPIHGPRTSTEALARIEK